MLKFSESKALLCLEEDPLRSAIKFFSLWGKETAIFSFSLGKLLPNKGWVKEFAFLSATKSSLLPHLAVFVQP